MKRSKLFDQVIAKSWWTILCILLCLFSYDIAMRKKVGVENGLQQRLVSLEQKISKALENQEDMRDRIANADDRDSIELTLMRKLGLVAENQTKVVFK